MKINLIKFLMGLVALLIFPPQVHAYDFHEGGLYYQILSRDYQTVAVTYGHYSSYENKNYYEGDIEIPKEVVRGSKTYLVVAIGESAFSGCSGVTSVTIPTSVTEIGSNAFSNCSGLTSLTIPTSVTTIGNGAFYRCSGLTSMAIPTSVTAIGSSAFAYCCSLKEIEVEEGNAAYVSRDGVLYTKDCATLHSFPGGKVGSFSIPTTVTTIGDSAFRYCEGLTSVNIPNSVTAIDSYAFSVCKGLTSVTIPNSVTTIGNSAFRNCTGLTSVAIPNSVTKIADDTFLNCTKLESATISNSATSIGEDAFAGCWELREITIPNSVIRISRCAFSTCSHLNSVTIPNSVRFIGDMAFEKCDAIRKIYCHWESPGSVAIGGNVFSTGAVLRDAILYVPKGCKSAYEEVRPWEKFLHIEELDYSGITEISADGLNISVTDGVINIDCAGSETLVEVFDIAGKTVYRGYGHTVTGLSNGIYIVKVGSQTRKIRI